MFTVLRGFWRCIQPVCEIRRIYSWDPWSFCSLASRLKIYPFKQLPSMMLHDGNLLISTCQIALSISSANSLAGRTHRGDSIYIFVNSSVCPPPSGLVLYTDAQPDQDAGQRGRALALVSDGCVLPLTHMSHVIALGPDMQNTGLIRV